MRKYLTLLLWILMAYAYAQPDLPATSSSKESFVQIKNFQDINNVVGSLSFQDSTYKIADQKRFDRGSRIQTRAFICLAGSLLVCIGGFALFADNIYQDNVGNKVGAILYFSGAIGVIVVVPSMLIKGAYIKHRARTHPPSVAIGLGPQQFNLSVRF